MVALQDSVTRLRHILAQLPELFHAAAHEDPLPAMQRLAADLLEADSLQILIPAGLERGHTAELGRISVPVLLGGRPTGRMDAHRAYPFDDDDRAVARAIGQMVGMVLEQSAAYSQLNQYRDQVQANDDTLDQLLSFARHIVSGTANQRELAVRLATQVLHMVGGERASILLFPLDQPEQPVLIFHTGVVASPERAIAVRDQGLAGVVLRERRPLIIDETDTDRRWLSLGHHEVPAATRCAMAVPLLWGERIVGVLTVTTTRSRLFNTPQLNLLELVACHVSLALRSAELEERLVSLHDTLAGTHQALAAAVETARRAMATPNSPAARAQLAAALEEIHTLSEQLRTTHGTLHNLVVPRQ
jgi:GAF domain-containing protein